MKRDLQTAVALFPRQLMSTARSALTMPATFGREVRNMLMAADGAGSKRNGVTAVGSEIDGEAIVAVMGFMAAGGYQVLAATDAGKIYLQDADAWEEVHSGLDPEGVVRTVTFGGRLVLCNGVDEVMAWDGTAWSVVRRFVTDAASGLTYIGADSFSIESDAAFYAVGSAVRLVLDSGEVEAGVASVSTVGDVVTVTLDGAVLDETLSAVSFCVKPPRFAFLAVAHDRLWGFGKGPLSAQMSGDVDRLRVFYTYGVNDHTAWPDEETGVVPSINLADKAGSADELMAMAVKDNITVFFGRNHMQLWTGSDPDADGNFMWSKTMPLGVIHGGAVLELPNDLLFVSRSGVRTLSRTVQTEQLDVSDVGGELDPTVRGLVEQVLADSGAYKRVVTVRNDAQGWLGLGFYDRTLVWQVGTFGRGWVVFDGVFAGIGGSLTTPGGQVYLAKGGRLYRYDRESWSDDGAAIKTVWHTPWIAPAKERRWANKYVEVLVLPEVEVPFTLRRYGDYDDANPRQVGMVSPAALDFWEEAAWNASYWDNGVPVVPLERDHVVAQALAYAVESETDNGPFTLYGIKLYGVAER